MKILLADTQKTREDFKMLLNLSLLDKHASCFLGKENWGTYLKELLDNEEEMSQTCHVSYFGDVPVGYVVASPNEPDHIYLSEVYVIPKSRGMGFAKVMLKEVLKMTGASKIHAYVHEDNVAMQKVLESLGGNHSGKWYDYLV